MKTCGLCGKIIIADLQPTSTIEGFAEIEGMTDIFVVHTNPCAEEVKKELKKRKTEKAQMKYLLSLLKKISN